MIEGDTNSRVVFRDAFQNRMFNEIINKLGKGWSRNLCEVLDRSPEVICGYSKGKYNISLGQLNLLCKIFELDEHLVTDEIQTFYSANWGSSRGAAITNSKHRHELSAWGRKGAYAIQAKYPVERFAWIEKAVMKAGKRAAAVQPLTFLELKVLRKLPKNSLKIHETVENDYEYGNIDFICNEQPIEVISNPHNKGEMFCRIMDVVSKSRMMKKRFFIVFEDFGLHPDAVLLAIEEGIVPVSLNTLNLLNRYLLRRKRGTVERLVETAKSEALKAISRRQRQMAGAAKREMNKMYPFEQTVHDSLKHLHSQGKIILKSRYGTFAVPDNFADTNDGRYVFLVTKRCGTTNSLRSSLRDHAGYSYMLKKIYGKYKVISVIITPRTLELETGKAFKFYTKNVDYRIIGNLPQVTGALRRLDLNRSTR